MPPLPVDATLSLRPLSLDDVDPLVALVHRNADHLRPWMPWAHDYGPSEAETFVRASLDAEERVGFHHEGTLRQAMWVRELPHDVHVFSLLAAELVDD